MSRRYAFVIGLRPEKADEYLRLHEAVPQPIADRLYQSNVRDFRIFHRTLDDGSQILVMTYDYVGSDHDADMRLVAEDPATQEWWKLTAPCQLPLVVPTEGAWWAEMREVCTLTEPAE